MKTKLAGLVLLLLSVCLGAQLSLPTGSQIYISVNVTGFVANPGSYQLTPLNRVSDALSISRTTVNPIEAANLSPLQLLKIAERDSLLQNYQALRSVQLTRGKETQTLDLLRFMRNGDLSQNPLLKDGDVLVVSAMRSSVTLLGEVYQPGEYEFVPGDQIEDLLWLGQGFTLGADRKNITVYRYQEGGAEFATLRLDLSGGSTSGFALQAGDRVIVNRDADARRAWKVTVEGRVSNPGEYLIGENTTLWDILQLCGGPSPRGDLGNAVLASGRFKLEEDLEFNRLKEFSMTQMTAMEYHYLRNRLRQFPGRYSLDVARVWESGGTEGNQILRDGDYLYVPENLDMVEVSGQVRNPGLVPWVEGKNWEYYIETAGGFTNNARWRGARVIEAASGNWTKPDKKKPLHPGDTVFVTEKTERDFWTDVKDVMLVATQLVTVFLGVRAITAN